MFGVISPKWLPRFTIRTPSIPQPESERLSQQPDSLYLINPVAQNLRAFYLPGSSFNQRPFNLFRNTSDTHDLTSSASESTLS